MSVYASAWAWRQDTANDKDRLVLLCLADRASHDGIGKVGRDTIASMCCLSKSSVTRCTERLADAGLIAKVRRFRGNGSRTSDWYVLAPIGPRGDMHDPDEEEQGDVLEAAARQGVSLKLGPSRDDDQVSNQDRPSVTAVTRPEPSEEPSGNNPSSSEPSGREASTTATFDAWAQLHQLVTGQRPPGPRTKAFADIRASYFARCAEGYEPADLELAVHGAWNDSYRRENGYVSMESILRPTKIHALIEKGRAGANGHARGSRDHREAIIRAVPETGTTDQEIVEDLLRTACMDPADPQFLPNPALDDVFPPGPTPLEAQARLAEKWGIVDWQGEALARGLMAA